MVNRMSGATTLHNALEKLVLDKAYVTSNWETCLFCNYYKIFLILLTVWGRLSWLGVCFSAIYVMWEGSGLWRLWLQQSTEPHHFLLLLLARQLCCWSKLFNYICFALTPFHTSLLMITWSNAVHPVSVEQEHSGDWWWNKMKRWSSLRDQF